MARLTRDQLKRLLDALLAAYQKREDFEFLVFSIDNRPLDQLARTGDLTNDIRRVVMVATQERWIADLVAEAASDRPRVAELADLAKELTPIVTLAAVADPWKACLVNGLPLVDRQPVRDAVRNLDTQGGSRLLSISGPATSGKSHTLNLVSWRADEGKDGLVLIELSKLVDRSAAAQDPVSPRRLAEAICEQMGVDPALLLPEGGEQDSRWGYAFCNRLQAYVLKQRAANPSPVRWWIAIDELNSVPISQQTSDLLKELATRIGKVLTEFRLVLLGYADVLPPNIGAVQRAELEHLTGDELQTYFIDLYLSTGKPPDPDRVAQAIAYVLQRFNPSDPLRMRALGEHVAAETQAILAS